jgi:hypothetical protein
MMGKYTEEELELLTDDEREALEFDESATDGDDPPEPAEEPKDEPKEEPEADEEQEVEQKDELEGETEVEGEKQEEPPAENIDEIPKVDFVPKPTQLTDEVKAAIKAEANKLNAGLQTQLDELKTQYDEGEIDTVEYFDKASGIREEISANKSDVRDHIRNQFQQQEVGRQKWEAEQDAFFKMNEQYDAPVYDKDNNLVKGNPILYGALDAACQKISRENPDLSGIDLLIKAKAEVDSVMGVQQKAKAKSAKPKAPRPGKNVGDLAPSAPESTQGEFGYLDKLEGDKLEEELAKMPAEKRDRYLQGA